MPKKNQTNIAFLIDLMEYSRHGAMMQAFVLDALTKHSNRVAESKPEDYPDNSMVNPLMWIGCAMELKEALGKQYGTRMEVVQADKYIATFKPQVWENDYAVDVEPRGADTYDVTECVMRLAEGQRSATTTTSRYNDHLRNAATAPNWVTEWEGPFEITVEKQS